MRKFYIFALVLILAMAGLSVAQAASSQYQNVQYIDGTGAYNQPPQFVKRVRFGLEGLNQASVMSGETVIWDITSHDGYTVARPGAGATNGDVRFAGIAVTTLLTQDVGGTGNTQDDNYGYICVKGYALASVDAAITSSAFTSLMVSATWPGALGTAQDSVSSQDVAVLLQTSGAAGMVPVWVK